MQVQSRNAIAEQRAASFAHCQARFHETVDCDHGRLEVRRHWATDDIDWLKERHAWPGLQSVALIERQVERNGQSETTQHLYISSLPADAVLLARAARAHWGIENRLHWVLDVVFHDDLSRLRSGFGPQNFAVVKHTALNLLNQAKAKHKHSLKPDVLDRVELGRSRGQQDDGEVFRDLELIGAVPPGAVHQDNAMGQCRDVAADLVEMHLHGARVGEVEHEGGALGPHGADGA